MIKPCKMSEFVDVHGREIKGIKITDTGEILIPLSEILITGFRIYKKSLFNKLLVDDEQLNKEFSLYLLSCAKEYMLNKQQRFTQEEILDTIKSVESTIRLEHENKPNLNSSKKSERYSLSPKSSNLTVNNVNSLNKNEKKPGKSSSIKSYQSRESNKNDNLVVNKCENLFSQLNDSTIREPKDPPQNYNRPSHNKSDTSLNLNDSFNGSNGDVSPRAGTSIKNGNITPRIRIWQDPSPNAINLSLNETYEGVVSYVEPNKPTIIWIQLNEKIVGDILTELNDNKKLVLEPETPKPYKMCMAEHEGLWFRAKVEDGTPFRVFFIDYGNSLRVNEIKKLPQHLKKIPNQAVRASYRPKDFTDLNVDDKLTFKVQFKHEDQTYNICPPNKPFIKRETSPIKTINNQENHLNNLPQIFFDLPEANTIIRNQLVVKIVNEDEGHLMLRTKGDWEVLKSIEGLLNNYEGEPIKDVQLNQLVVCPNATGTANVRGVVEKIEGENVTIKYLDYCEISQCPKNSLKHITKELATKPLTIIKSPKFVYNYSKETFSNFLKDLSVNKKNKKFWVKLVDGKMDLINENNENLSDILKKLETPKEDISNGRLMYKDLKKIKVKVGSLLECSIYSMTNINNVTIIPTQYGDDLEKVIGCETLFEDDPIYVPILNEICLAKFEEGWYRTVIDAKSGPQYICEFIDFGNVENVDANDLRKISDEMKQIPVLGIKAQFSGLSVKNFEKMKTLINDGDTKEIKIVGYNDVEEKYQIEIPEVYQQL